MILRKVNAILSLIATVMLLKHAVSKGIWMLSGCTVTKTASIMPFVLFLVMMLHAVISILLGILGHKGAEKRKCNGYPHMNRTTYMQRGSGVALILFTVLHIAGAIGLMHPPKVIHAILPPLFFAVALMHGAISTSKAFITLGIGSSGFIKGADIAAKVICGATLIADVVGFYLCLC